MKIYVRFGHEYLTNGNCTAASGFLKEYDVIGEYAAQLAFTLYKAGHEVRTGGHTNGIYPTVKEALYAGVNEAKNWGAELFISCHANGGAGTGPEVYYKTNDAKSLALAQEISTDISTLLGLSNRGAKDGNGLYETKPTTFSIPSIIIEPFYVDTQNDCNKYTSIGGTSLGNTIATSVLATI